VKHWQETAAVLERLAGLGPDRRAALATVVRIEGSSYRRPGAKLLVVEDGATAGGVSGGCLEADVREVAREVIRTGRPRLRHYATGAEASGVFGLGLGCEGAVDVFVLRLPDGMPADVQRRAADLVRARAPFALSIVLEGPAAGAVRVWGPPAEGETIAPDVEGAFVERLSPPPRLAVFGAGDDAVPLCRIAVLAGFDVVVVDHREAVLTAERFPHPVRRVLRRAEEGVAGLGLGRQQLAVVLTHALEHDRGWVRALLREPLAYLGLLGPRSRRDDLLRELGLAGDPPPQLYAPVGLDLGADGSEQIAISVVAEALAVHAGRTPGHLRAGKGGLHAG
jgi:xanthine/CO dehydrogenase XdhC/CoxF family maturation factor